jgi:hypothetical protein
MTRLKLPLNDCRSGLFARQLKHELEHLQAGTLPLEQATTQGGQVDDSNISANVIEVREDGGWIRARVGIFFNEVVGGCSCGDDPLSVNAYCQIQVSIDRASATAEFAVIPE